MFKLLLVFTLCSLVLGQAWRPRPAENAPMVYSTGHHPDLTELAFNVMNNGGTATEAIEAALSRCEERHCQFDEKYGSSPNENGETVLDAIIYDGYITNSASVNGLRRINNAISVARTVMEHTNHSAMMGSLASDFAVRMGFEEEEDVLTTPASKQTWLDWKNNKCQPNFWTGNRVTPNPQTSCGPYTLKTSPARNLTYVQLNNVVREIQMDVPWDETIAAFGMIAMDKNGRFSAGNTGSGSVHRITGAIGLAGVPGGGAYSQIFMGAAVAVGENEHMIRYSPCVRALTRNQWIANPDNSAKNAIVKMKRGKNNFRGAVLLIDYYGKFGVACNGWKTFVTTWIDKYNNKVPQVTTRNCL